MKKVHLVLTIFWALNVPPVIILYVATDPEEFQKLILLYITIVSIYANFVTHWVGVLTAKVEKEQKEGTQNDSNASTD